MHLTALCGAPLLTSGQPKKLLRTMKLTAIILLSACLTASAKGYSQITLSEKNAPLQKVFKEIQKQSGYDFFYTYELIEQAGNVSVRVKNVSLEKAMQECLDGKGLTFEIVNRTVVIKKATVTNPENEFTLPPPIDIRGRIVNEDGEGVVANIIVKGTQNGTSSNSDGYFELKNIDENATLVITGVSIETIEFKVNGRAEINVTAKTKISEGEDVTVKTNYWETKQRFNPGNIGKVDAKTIERQPVTNVLSAIQNRVPGVEVTQNSGVPGGSFSVRIRGDNSVRSLNLNETDPNEPLYVVDGVPFHSASLVQVSTIINNGNPLNALNPADIESIEILKDADATAIYGSRGANGVVLITTKKGKGGKTKLDINVSTGMGRTSSKMKLLNTEQYLEMRKEAFANDGVIPTTANAPDLTVWDQTRYTDWQKELLGGIANYTNAQASFSGGNANTQFLFSGNYSHETTVYPGDNSFQRGSGHFNINHFDNSRRFNLNLTTTYTISKNNLPQQDLTTAARTLPPNAPNLYNIEGKLNWALVGTQSTWTNPITYLRNPYEAKVNNLNTNLLLNYQVLKYLKLRTSLGYTNITNEETEKDFASELDPTYNPQTGMWLGKGSVNTWIAEPQAEFSNRLFNGDITILLGATFQESVQKLERISASGFSSDALINNIAGADNITIYKSDYVQYKYNAIYGRINYNLQNRYIVNLTARRDGSSRFGPGKQFANFGAVGMAWVFSSEDFIKNNLSFLSFGKLRSSYGITGSDNIGDYRFLDSYEPSFFSYLSGGLLPVRLANPDYGWEENKKYEVGLDLGFLQDRIQFTTSWYRNRSSNQLLGLPLPATAGPFGSVQINLPATIQNTGWEFELHTNNINNNNFSWRTGINLTVPNSKVIEFPYLDQLSDFKFRFVIGKPTTTSQRYQFLGIDPLTGNYQFSDVNMSGSITSLDRKSLINTGPKFYGGVNNSLSYKGFSLDFFFQFRKQAGNDFFNSFSMPGTRTNQPVEVLDRWQHPGDVAGFMKFSQGSSTNFSNWRISDGIITDISYIRLQNASLSYELPVRWRERIKLQNARIYLRGQNLFAIGPGKSYILTLPLIRTIITGIQLTF